MIKNKKAWIKIVEAAIAVLIVLSFVLLLFSRQNAGDEKEKEISKMLRYTLDYLSNNENARNQVIARNSSNIDKIISPLIPEWLNFSSRICSTSEVCSNPAGFMQKTVYSDEILVFANLTYYSGEAVKLKVFLWEK